MGNTLWSRLFEWILGFVQAIVRDRGWAFWGKGRARAEPQKKGNAVESRKFSLSFEFGGETVRDELRRYELSDWWEPEIPGVLSIHSRFN